MNCRKCGNLLNGNETICRVCGENNMIGLNNNFYMNQNMNQNMNQTVAQQQMYSGQQPMYGMQNNQYVQPPRKNGAFVVIFIILLLVILGLGGFVGYNLLSKNDAKQVEKNKDVSQNNDNKKETEEKNKEESTDKKENEEIATNAIYYELYGYKFPVPKELILERVENSFLITDNTYFQLQFSLAADSYSNIVSHPEYYKQEFEKIGVTIEKYYEKKYVGKKFYLFKVNNNGSSALFYVTEVDDNLVGTGIIMATSSSAYEKGLNYVSKMVTDSSKNSNFVAGENNNGLSSSPEINKDIFDNAKIDSVEYTE